MKQKRSTASSHLSHMSEHGADQIEETTSSPLLCDCSLLTDLHTLPSPPVVQDTLDTEQYIPASQHLYRQMVVLLQELLPRVDTLSLLFIHMFQREPAPLAPHSSSLYRRRRYHAASSQFQQVLTNVRRVIRGDDTLLIADQAGAVLAFPGVTRQSIEGILERVYASISLLQAETLVPPLTRETLIQVGVGSYPSPAASFEQLLVLTSRTARCLTLRPALTAHLHGIRPVPTGGCSRDTTREMKDASSTRAALHIPHLELPRTLSPRLTQLVPYQLALQLRCVPVGRNQASLTVAMAEPTNAQSIQQLAVATGLSIFPVACDQEALNTLLTQAW